MRIILTDTGKRFNREWIFRHCNLVFEPGGRYAITGPNGSGKSTLLQVIAGAVLPSEGKLEYEFDGKTINEESYRQIGIAAPYLELIEEMTANEILQFHSKFKTLRKTHPEMLAAVGLEKATHKQIRYYSSGMKQRLKLALAFFSDTSVLLLDEPTTNLDEEGIRIYQKLLEEYSANRLVIVSSNDKAEYAFCEKVVSVPEFK